MCNTSNFELEHQPRLRNACEHIRRACYNIWHRVLEGYHAWEAMLGQRTSPKFEEAEVERYFVEALISRLSGSMAEHLIHSPESRQ